MSCSSNCCTKGWISVDASMPDDDINVLVFMPNNPGEPVWIGYHDSGGAEGDNADGKPCWRLADGMPVEVTHWQHIPEGPAGNDERGTARPEYGEGMNAELGGKA